MSIISKVKNTEHNYEFYEEFTRKNALLHVPVTHIVDKTGIFFLCDSVVYRNRY
jgi:hypothetical protein